MSDLAQKKAEARERIMQRVGGEGSGSGAGPGGMGGHYSIAPNGRFEARLELIEGRMLDDGIRVVLSPPVFFVDPQTKEHRRPVTAVLMLPREYAEHVKLGRGVRVVVEGA